MGKVLGGLIRNVSATHPSFWTRFCVKAKGRRETFPSSLFSEQPRHRFCLWNAGVHLLHIKVHSTFLCPLSSRICSTFPSLPLIFLSFFPFLAGFKGTGKFTIACVTKTKKNKSLLFEDHQNNFWFSAPLHAACFANAVIDIISSINSLHPLFILLGLGEPCCSSPDGLQFRLQRYL